MIKFFRKIRHKLLSEGKTGRYLKYAIGEVVLVVIGILIALQINNWNETKKSNDKIDAIFENLLEELASDIEYSTSPILYYQYVDSVSSLILNTNLNYEDFTNSENKKLFYVTTYWWTMLTSQSAYNALMQNVDLIPSKYDKIVKSLNYLYTINLEDVNVFNERMKDHSITNINNRMRKYEWYSNIPYSENIDAINYHLQSFEYRNEVYAYRALGIGNHLRKIKDYRLGAIDAFKSISIILNKPTDSLNFIIDTELLADYEGYFKNDSLNELIHVQIKDDQLFATYPSPDPPRFIYPLSRSKFFSHGIPMREPYGLSMVEFQTINDTLYLINSINHHRDYYAKTDSFKK